MYKNSEELVVWWVEIQAPSGEDGVGAARKVKYPMLYRRPVTGVSIVEMGVLGTHFILPSSLLIFFLIQEVHEDAGQTTLSTTHPEGPGAASSAPEPTAASSSQAEKAVPSKSLLDWLRQQADYSLDVPGFGAVSVGCCYPIPLTANGTFERN